MPNPDQPSIKPPENFTDLKDLLEKLATYYTGLYPELDLRSLPKELEEYRKAHTITKLKWYFTDRQEKNWAYYFWELENLASELVSIKQQIIAEEQNFHKLEMAIKDNTLTQSTIFAENSLKDIAKLKQNLKTSGIENKFAQVYNEALKAGAPFLKEINAPGYTEQWGCNLFQAEYKRILNQTEYNEQSRRETVRELKQLSREKETRRNIDRINYMAAAELIHSTQACLLQIMEAAMPSSAQQCSAQQSISIVTNITEVSAKETEQPRLCLPAAVETMEIAGSSPRIR